MLKLSSVEHILAFGIIVWIWNRLGLPERVTLIGNIGAIVLLFVVVFLL